MPPLEIQVFSPSIRQPPARRVAVVVIAATSEPASGSLNANAAMRSPRRACGSTRAAQRRLARQRDRRRAQPLHGEGEIRQPRVAGEDVAREADRAHVDRLRARPPAPRRRASRPRRARAPARGTRASTSLPSRCARCAAAQASSALRELPVPVLEERPVEKAPVHDQSPSNTGLRFVGEGFVGAGEVPGLHAERLRLRLRLDRRVDVHAPFLMQAALRHRVRRTSARPRAPPPAPCASASSASGAHSRL